jgi:hypothetical protein
MAKLYIESQNGLLWVQLNESCIPLMAMIFDSIDLH